MPDFTAGPKHERPRGALEAWSEANWSKLPKRVREAVEGHLRRKLEEEARELLAKWRGQHARGISIGSDDPTFHFGVGMDVRNVCRDQLTDQELPRVEVDHEGKPYGPHEFGLGNWDDYYFGVLAAIAA